MMVTDPDGPADTTMMRIVHRALRRDLGRARSALGQVPAPAPDRLHAIADHLVWMMGFLHAHHEAEDRGLYRVVRERAPGRPEVLEVLDRMEHHHHAIAPAIAAVEAAATTVGTELNDTAIGSLVAALDDLSAELLPHLDQEEREAMPAVAALVTNAEWLALEREHNLDPKSFSELGREGHWLIDDADDADRATVLGLVPALPRFLLVHGFARGYRRRRDACWGTAPAPKRRVQKRGHVSVVVDADIEAAWDIVRDVTRVGEWSHECVGAVWTGEVRAPAVGARFRGRNRAGLFRWGRVCEIVAADPYELAWTTVPTVLFPDSTEWRIRLVEDVDGTRIEQSFRVIRAPKLLDALYARLIPAHRDRSAALADDLRRLGIAANRSASPPGRAASRT